MFNIFCPICGEKMNPCIDHFECETCGVSYSLPNKFFYVTNKAPKYVVDSYNILKLIHENKWMFVFGKRPLFTEGFSQDDCVGYQSSTNITAMTPKQLLGYNGISALHLHTLVYGMSEDKGDFTHLLQIENAMTVFSMWASAKMSKDKHLDYNTVKMLTAVMSPTWYDCAEVLMDNMSRDITTWSDSELLGACILCNKFPIIQGCNLTTYSEVLRKFIVNQCKFIHKDNSKLTATDVAERKEAYELILNANVELRLINDGHMSCHNNVQWLFATNNTAVLPDDDSIKEYSAQAEGLWRLWEDYVKGISNAHSAIMKSEVTYDEVHRDACETYINYWSKVRTKFE